MKKLRLSLYVLLMAIWVVGCSSVSESGTNEEKGKESEKKKNYTLDEVIDKANKQVSEVNGVTYDVKGKQDFTMEIDGKTQVMGMDIAMVMNYTNDPVAMHMKGNLVSNEEKIPMEAYLVDNEMYQTGEGGGWIKTKVDGMQGIQGTQAQQPSESLKQFKTVLDKLSGNKKDGPVKMTEEEDAYLLEMNLTEKDSKELFDEMTKQMKSSIAPQLEGENLPVQLDDIKFSQLNQKIWVDKESFDQKKVDQVMEMEIPIEDMKMKIKQNMIMELKGEYKDKITVPEDVKSKARSF